MSQNDTQLQIDSIGNPATMIMKQLPRRVSLKLTVQDAAIEHTCHARSNGEQEINLEDAKQDLEECISNITPYFKNREVYGEMYDTLFTELIERCLEMVVADWGDSEEYSRHIEYINNFILSFKSINKRINTLTFPFGSKLPLDIQDRILSIYDDESQKNNILDKHINPLLEYLEQKKMWAYDLQIHWD